MKLKRAHFGLGQSQTASNDVKVLSEQTLWAKETGKEPSKNAGATLKMTLLTM